MKTMDTILFFCTVPLKGVSTLMARKPAVFSEFFFSESRIGKRIEFSHSCQKLIITFQICFCCFMQGGEGSYQTMAAKRWPLVLIVEVLASINNA